MKGISIMSDEGLSSPSSLKFSLKNLIRRKGLANRSAAEALNAEWSRIVGPKIGTRSTARRIKDGVLEVVVTNSAAMEELRSYLHESVLAQMQSSLPESNIRSIRYVRAR
jgi:predicted nucleic acid-binding Zn ribbon protein